MKQMVLSFILLFLLPFSLFFSITDEIQQGMLFLAQKSFFNTESANDTLYYITNLTEQFFSSLNTFLNEGTDPSIQACNDNLTNLIKTNITTFYELFSYNGKSYSDVGQEEACGYYGFKYIKALYEIDKGNEISEESQVIQFLNLNKLYTGLCLPEICLTALEELKAGAEVPNKKESLTKKIPNTLFDYIKTHFFLKNISFLHPPSKTLSPDFLWFKILIYIIIAYFALKVIFTIIRITCFSSDNTKVQEGRIEMDEEDDQNIYFNDKLDDDHNNGNNNFKHDKKEFRFKTQFIFTRNSNVVPLINESLSNTSLKHRSESFMSLLVKFFDFFQNLHIMTIANSKYFNDKHISMLSFIRVILMFFITYNHNFFTTTKMPGKDFLHFDFYKSFLFFSIKLSIHALPLWIVVDAATFVFKFMSSIKSDMRKKNQSSISFTFILKWWLYTIPKIVLFFFIFFFFHVLIDYYQLFFETGTMFEYYLQNFQDRECTQRPWELLIPFFIPYKDNTRGFVYCYRFVYVLLNEFYCFILLTLYFYIILKIKSKIVDYVFLSISVLNAVLTCLSIPFTNSEYDINNVLGQNFTDKYTHLTLSFYLMGAYVGMSYFYYYDAVSKDSLSQNYSYFPFCYCYSSVKFLDRLRTIYKKLLLWSCLLILFIDSMSYMFIRLIRQTPDNSLCFIMDTFINIYEQYDKILFAVLFSLILVLLLLLPKETTIRNLIASNIFFPFSRIGTAFLCLSNSIIYIVYSIFLIQLKLSYSNLFFITIGMFVIISFISLLVALMFELPFRILFKTIVRMINKKEPSVLNDMLLLHQINQSMQLFNDD